MQYKIYELDTVMSKNGKEFKKMVLKAEDATHTEERVTMWDNHPEYTTAKAGGTINGDLEKKDSGTPIPAHPEKNYVNRTLLPETNDNGTVKTNTNMELRLAELEAWARSKGFLPKKDEPETNSDGSPTPNFEPKEEINFEEENPFD